MAEHVNSQFVFYPSVFSAGRRLWVLVNPEMPVQFRHVASDVGVIVSTPGNSTVAFLSAVFLFDGPTSWVIACCWFESSLRLQMPD